MPNSSVTVESQRASSEIACCYSASPPGAGYTLCYKPHKDPCPRVLRLLLNCVFAPFYWVWRAIDIYLLGCIHFYLARTCGCLVYMALGPCGLYYYKDKRFPAKSRSLGHFGGKSQSQLDQEIVWKRAADIFPEPRDGEQLPGDCTHRAPTGLFTGKVEPADIFQGEIGDCWLMTSLACAAEYRGSIHNLFVTKEYNARGKYTVRLYDGLKKKWRRIHVDDMLPCKKSSGKPIFAQPNDREMWVLIFEKAFAKMMGGYDRLDGGNICLAFQALTGDPVFHLSKNRSGSVFEKFLLKYYEPRADDKDDFGRTKTSIGLAIDDSKHYDKNKLFHVLRTLIENKALIGAGTSGRDQGEKTANQGLVQGHAYTVLDVREVSDSGLFSIGSKEKFRLVKLRNPWGRFEWTGAFSDGSAEWTKFKNVASKLKHKKKDDVDDGVFWMPYDDFWKHFGQIDVCDRSSGFGDLYYGVDEARGFCGPAQGCLYGCAKYWCLCKGCRASVYGRAGGEPFLGKGLLRETEV